jgi:ParB family chromosome partitioning protein
VTGTFDPAYPVAELRGADYNPRAISADAEAALDESIRTLGFAKPVIVTVDGLIVAGHQRTKSAGRLGLETVPAWVLPAIAQTDEIRFNQLHNGTDVDDTGDHPVRVPDLATLGELGAGGFGMVPAHDVDGNLRSPGAVYRTEICGLLARYGNWGAAVATVSGLVVSGQQYALACKIVGMPVRVFYVSDEQAGRAVECFGQRYGEFRYDHLERTTYMQAWAQIMRLRDGHTGKALKSDLYEKMVLPELARSEAVLDFGCGQGDYVRALRARGYRIVGYEPFARGEAGGAKADTGDGRRHMPGSMLDKAKVRRQAGEVAAHLAEHGRFDVVIADAVINSVDSQQAEDDVLDCLHALVKPGGRVYFSTRRREMLDEAARRTQNASRLRYFEFLDDDGFTALYRKGAWFFQKWHYRQQVEELAGRFTDEPPRILKTSIQWKCATRADRPLQQSRAVEAMRREFDLPWPDGTSVGRADEVIAAWRNAIEREGR